MATSKEKPAAKAKPSARAASRGGRKPADKTAAENGTWTYTSIYLDPDTKALLDSMAKAAGMNRSEMVRALVNGAGKTDEPTKKRLLTLAAELRQIAVTV